MAGIKAPKDGALDSSAIRIRDNQRRSRARRKEYLEDIQKKLQMYERQGVQATLDMQHAARDVAIENERLRMLLQQRGVTADEIAQFLQSFPANPPEPERKLKVQLNPSPRSPPQRPGHMRPKMALPPLAASATTPPKEKYHHQVSTPAAAESVTSTISNTAYFAPAMCTPPEYASSQTSVTSYMDVVLPPIQSITEVEDTAVDKLAVLAHASTRQGCCGGQTQCSVPVEVSQAPSPAATHVSSSQPHSRSPSGLCSSSPTEMSCSQAAQIIAEMQGHGDYKLAKVALGCKGRDECTVKNSTIFHVLENREPT